MGKMIQVASDREFDQTKTVLPAEYARGAYIQNPPSAEALKVMHFLIAAAGGRMADDVDHQFKLTELNATKGIRRHTRKTLEPLFQELAACVLTIDDHERQKVKIGGFLDEAEIDYSEKFAGDLRVKWSFRKTFLRMAAQSEHWAIIDRQTLFALTSKYSILLFQYFASLQNLDRKMAQSFSVEELRTLLGVSADKLQRFADFNRRVIKPAMDEINQLSRFTLSATPKKIGRSVVAVEISWTTKEDAKAVKTELQSSKVGRKARRDGTVEVPALAFPAGTIEFSKPWNEIALLHGGGKDKDLIAQDFRNWCQQQGIPLDKAGIEKTFEGFCRRARI